MKVLKKADVSDWTYKHKCVNCDSELEVEESDIIHRHYDGDMREASYDTYSAKCPVCNKTFSIPEASIPKLIKVNSKKRTGRSPDYLD